MLSGTEIHKHLSICAGMKFGIAIIENNCCILKKLKTEQFHHLVISQLICYEFLIQVMFSVSLRIMESKPK